MIDLHSHTTASDGSLTPTELIHLAKNVGLSAVAVTDHDTVGGLREASDEAARTGIEFVPGIEISVDFKPGQFHLLGFFIDRDHGEFNDRLQALQDNRVNRNIVMARKLASLGLPITLDDIVAEAGGDQVGRPHMAKALVKKGIVETTQEAFDRFLADGAAAHVPKMKLEPAAAIEMVHLAGGVAILAHPKFLRISDEGDLATVLAGFKDAGLDGIEAYYSQHNSPETDTYLRLARRFNFLISAGSDYHGVTKPHVHLGRIYQNEAGDPEILATLKRFRLQRTARAA